MQPMYILKDSCLPFTITLAVADDGYDNTVTSHV